MGQGGCSTGVDQGSLSFCFFIYLCCYSQCSYMRNGFLQHERGVCVCVLKILLALKVSFLIILFENYKPSKQINQKKGNFTLGGKYPLIIRQLLADSTGNNEEPEPQGKLLILYVIFILAAQLHRHLCAPLQIWYFVSFHQTLYNSSSLFIYSMTGSYKQKPPSVPKMPTEQLLTRIYLALELRH